MYYSNETDTNSEQSLSQFISETYEAVDCLLRNDALAFHFYYDEQVFSRWASVDSNYSDMLNKLQQSILEVMNFSQERKKVMNSLLSLIDSGKLIISNLEYKKLINLNKSLVSIFNLCSSITIKFQDTISFEPSECFGQYKIFLKDYLSICRKIRLLKDSLYRTINSSQSEDDPFYGNDYPGFMHGYQDHSLAVIPADKENENKKYEKEKESAHNVPEDNAEHTGSILPDEILVHTLTFIPLNQGWLTLSLVCKQWAELINSEVYWKIMLEKYFPGRKNIFDYREANLNGNKTLFLNHYDNSNCKYEGDFYYYHVEDRKVFLNKLFLRAKQGDLREFRNLLIDFLNKLNTDNLNSMRIEYTLKLVAHTKDIHGKTILEYAHSLGKQSILRWLLVFLISNNILVRGYSAGIDCRNLTLAVLFNQTQDIIRLVYNGENIDSVHEGNSLLGLAIRYRYMDTVRILLALGANPNPRSKPMVRVSNPLCEAIEDGHLEIVKILIEYGANILPDAIHTALSYGRKDIVHLLLDSNVKIVPSSSRLKEALNMEDQKIIKHILNNIIESNSKPKVRSPLNDLSIQQKHLIIHYLLYRNLRSQTISPKIDSSIEELLAMGAKSTLIKQWFKLDKVTTKLFDIVEKFFLNLNLLRDGDSSISRINEILAIAKKPTLRREYPGLYPALNGVFASHLYNDSTQEAEDNVQQKLEQVLYYLQQTNPDDSSLNDLRSRVYSQLTSVTTADIEKAQLTANTDSKPFRTIIANVYRPSVSKVSSTMFKGESSTKEPQRTTCDDLSIAPSNQRNTYNCPIDLFPSNSTRAKSLTRENYQKLKQQNTDILWEIAASTLDNFPKNQCLPFKEDLSAIRSFVDILEFFLQRLQQPSSSENKLPSCLLNSMAFQPGFCLWIFNQDIIKVQTLRSFMCGVSLISRDVNNEEITEEFKQTLIEALTLKVKELRAMNEPTPVTIAKESSCVLS